LVTAQPADPVRLAGPECDLECPHGQDDDRGEEVAAQHHEVNAKLLTEYLFEGSFAAVVITGAPLLWRARRQRVAAGGSAGRLADVKQLDRHAWRMPPLEQLTKPVMSPVRRTGLLLRGYLIVAVLLVTVKIFSDFIH
jgi:hypothetical protein